MLTSVDHSQAQPSASQQGAGVKHLRLSLILLLYLVLAVAYSVVTPIGRGADEWAHYWYAQFIAQNGRLPLNPAERETAGYKSDWPPLYHLSAAAVTAWIDTAGPPDFKYRDDPTHIRRQIISAPSSEAILHTEDELFPWQQEILVWHLGRFLSIVFSLGTLGVTYRLALEVFAGNKVAGGSGVEENTSRLTPHASRLTLSPQTLALGCVVFLAFIPRFLFTGMLFNYDSLTLLVASLFLWLGVRIAKGYYPRWGFWGLGVLAGLALLTKYLTALLPLEIIFLAFSKGAHPFGCAERRRGQGSRGETSISPLLPRSSAPLLKLGQAALAFILVTAPWFSYLLVNFNEIERYGPVLGSVAPLLRGDGSDRTVEQIFAVISGGQAPAPAHIDQQHYSAGQLISEFFTTLWTNPITRPSPLNWFVIVITGIAVVALLGLITWPQRLHPLNRSDLPSPPFLASSPASRRLLALHCLLPLPFMVIRLFGARDALEAVQGRHLLFLAGPALVILIVWGLQSVRCQVSRITYHASRIMFYGLTGLLLTGAALQLISLWTGYSPPLPVRTTSASLAQAAPPNPITLPGGAVLIDASITPVEPGWLNTFLAEPPVLHVVVLWQGGAEPAPEDYQMELALLDSQRQVRASWLGYQTQARYPTRAWEAGDTIRDEGWLPLERLDASRGDYQIRWRILGENGPVLDWQTLSTYTLTSTAQPQANESAQWLLWQEGQVVRYPPLLHERETAQFTFAQSPREASNLYLIGPDRLQRPPVSRGETWANFIIGPDWPAGEYRWQPDGQVVLRVAESGRNFQIPPLPHPVETNFAGQIKLLGYDLPTRRVRPGEGLPITLYWQGLRWMGEDFVIFNRLLDNEGMSWGGYDRRAKENYSTLYWAPGEVVSDGFAVPIDSTTPPGVYTLSLGWYRQVDGRADSLPIFDPATGEPNGLTAVTLGPIKVGGPPPGVTVAAAAPQIEAGITLGEQIKLLGFDVTSQQNGGLTERTTTPPTLYTSDSLHLTLYWQALTAVQTDYTVFAHVRDTGGETVAQKDTPPAGGVYPTSLWDTGEIVKGEIDISLDQVRPGSYQLVVGLYNFGTGARLPVVGSPDGTIELGRVEVTE